MKRRAWALRLARTRPGGLLAYLWVRFFPRLLPVRVQKLERSLIRMDHPVPLRPGHGLIVPRRRIRNLEAALRNGRAWAALAEALLRNVDADREMLLCNLGKRQEVGRLHFHVLPRDASAPAAAGVWDGKARCVLPLSALREPERIRACVLAGKRAGFFGATLYWI